MPERVVVRVPATVANLGPGFDCLGLALGWHNEVSVERAEALSVTVAGAGAEQIPRDETNLVIAGLAAALGEDPRVRIHQLQSIPLGSGFGSSAAAIVAGLVAGVALAGDEVDDQELLELAAAIEGHADNVAPCLAGGVTVSGGKRLARLDPPADVRVLACVAPGAFYTQEARTALPEMVTHGDASLNVSRSSLLVAALATGRTDLLMAGTDDRLHQPARFELMPETGELVRGLRGKGIAAFLSGAGPSAAALVAADAAEEAAAIARALVGEAWDVRIEDIDPHGATLVENR